MSVGTDILKEARMRKGGAFVNHFDPKHVKISFYRALGKVNIGKVNDEASEMFRDMVKATEACKAAIGVKMKRNAPTTDEIGIIASRGSPMLSSWVTLSFEGLTPKEVSSRVEDAVRKAGWGIQ